MTKYIGAAIYYPITTIPIRNIYYDVQLIIMYGIIQYSEL